MVLLQQADYLWEATTLHIIDAAVLSASLQSEIVSKWPHHDRSWPTKLNRRTLHDNARSGSACQGCVQHR